MLKKIINNYLPIFAIVIVAFMISWYILDSILLAIAYSMCVLVASMTLKKRIYIRNKKNHNIDAMYNFVNLMNVQMLSTTNVYEAYKSIESYVDIDFTNIANDDLHLQLNDIANDYGFNSFKMYVNTLIIYDTDGGNYKQMQEIPTSLCQKTKIYYADLRKKKTSKFIEVSTLYLLWLCVMMFIKSVITDYYSKMMENQTYQFIMLIILLIGSLLYYLTFKEYLKNKIRGM